MKFCKKPLAILLSLLMVLSMFGGLGITSFAASELQPGDVDGDGYITSADARKVLRISVLLDTNVPEAIFEAADINNDERVTAIDSRSILRMSALLDPVLGTAQPRTELDVQRSAAAKINFTYEDADYSIGDTFTVTVSAENANGLENANIFFNYDPQVLEAVNVRAARAGDMTSDAGTYESGKIPFAAMFSNSATLSDFELMTIEFKLLQYKTTEISYTIGTWNGTEVPADGTFTLGIASPRLIYTYPKNVVQGQTFDVVLSGKNIRGFDNGDLIINYDTEVLEAINIEGNTENKLIPVAGFPAPGIATASYVVNNGAIDLDADNQDLLYITFIAKQAGTTELKTTIECWYGTTDIPSEPSALIKITEPDAPFIYENETKAITTAKSTQQVRVCFNVSDFAGTESADLKFNYDPEYFECVDINAGENSDFSNSSDNIDPSGNNAAFSFFYMTCATENNMNIAELTFNMLKPGISNISVECESWEGGVKPPYMSIDVNSSCIGGSSTFRNAELTYEIYNEDKAPETASFIFIPEVTGRYVFSASSDGLDTFGSIYDIDNNLIASNDDSAGCPNPMDFSIVAELKAGYAYYLNSNYYGASGKSYNVSVSRYSPFTYTVNDGKATITGYNSYIGGSLEIPEAIDGYPVAAIGPYAFANTDITHVFIPGCVKEIGEAAFLGCYSLRSAAISDGVEAIGDYAFMNTWLESLAIPASVKEIGYGCFNECNNLSEIIADTDNTAFCTVNGVLYNKSMTEIIKFPGNMVAAAYTVPESVKKINAYAFSNCFSLSAVTFSSSLEEIDDFAFFGCACIKQLTIPASVKRIGESAFNFCYDLEAVIFNNRITEMGDCIFEECRELKNVVLPENLKVISRYMFFNCNKLESITIPESVEEIGSGAFTNCGFDYIALPDSVKKIGDYAFDQCYSLSDVAFGSGLTEIGTYAFSGCRNLTAVTIPANVTTIEEKAFGYDYGKDYCYLEDFLVTGYINTAAQSYAEANNFRFEAIDCAHKSTNVTGVVAATCISNGYTGDTYCTDCGALLNEGAVAPATGHNFEHIRKDATCKAKGEEYDKCVNCSAIENIKELPVADCYYGDWTVVTAATCTANGSKKHTCSVCGKEETEKIAAKGHSFGSWVVTKDATYTAEGELTKSCSCGEKQTQKTAKLVASEEKVNKTTSISIKYQDSTYDAPITVNAEKVTTGAAFAILAEEKGEFKATLYDISTSVNNKEVQPDGYVLVGIPLPEGYNADKTGIYYVDEEKESIVKLNSYYKDGFIWFETNHFSAYAVVDESGRKPEFMLGDVSGDGKISASDARTALRASAKLEKLTDLQKLAADANGDGKISASDARTILRVSAKLESFKK